MRWTLLAIIMAAPVGLGCSGNGTAAVPGTGGAAGGSSGGAGSGGVGAGTGGTATTAGVGGADAGIDSHGTAGNGGAENIGVAGAPGLSWRTLPSLAKARQNSMGAAVGDTMYVIGGLDENGLLDEVESLGPAQATWTPAPPLPAPQCCAAVGVLGTTIAVAGGYGSDGHTPTNVLSLFDTTTGVWQAGPPMPTARANAMGAVWNGKLAVIGGGTQYGATQATGVIELYDPGANSWSTSTLAVTPRAAGVAVAGSDSRIDVIGGALQNSLYGNPIVEIVTATSVTAGPSLSLGRAQIAGGLLPYGFVVAGGWTAAGDTPLVEGLLGAGTVWQSLPPMPTSRAGAAAAVVNGSLIVAGGGQYPGKWVYQNVVEALDLN